MIRLRSIAAVAFAVAITGGSALAALSSKYADWPKGPVQWLMTRDDWRAWKNVKTDEEAQAFIDLFWARRDPTVGTYQNEFQAEFEGRVAYADANYKSEHGKRGSGTTIMAAERVGRHARALEIEPRFVDVAIRRWQAFTRRDARHAESGLSFDEIAADSSRSGRFASRSDEAKE